jgi:hypothetical protein
MKKQSVWMSVGIVMAFLMMSATVASASSLAGKWNINFNGFTGTMEISGDDVKYSGRFKVHTYWEEMFDLRIVGNRISFRRDGADQYYRGNISGNSMNGSFTQGGTGNYPWKANRIGSSTSSPRPAKTSRLAGTWNVNFNGFPGTMEISGDDVKYSGRFNLHGYWEEMLDLRIGGDRIVFRRDGADQHYSGNISGNSMSGNFTQGGTGNYPWRANRR